MAPAQDRDIRRPVSRPAAAAGSAASVRCSAQALSAQAFFLRCVPALLLCLLLSLACPVQVQAAAAGTTAGAASVEETEPDPGMARQLLETSIERILTLLQNPNYVNPATRGPYRRQIEDEVYHIFDFAEFSARTLGQSWRNFTADEKGSFTEAFASLLFSTYLNQIDGYNGEKVRIVSERRSSSRKRVEIGTELTMSDGRILPVSYRMMFRNDAAGGTWVVYDVFVEGISLVNNYRTQFQEILISSSPATLIERVRARAMEAGS